MTNYKLVEKENSPSRHEYYELETPINGVNEVLVSQSDIIEETMIFPVNNGEIDWLEVWSAKEYVNHEEALKDWIKEQNNE